MWLSDDCSIYTLPILSFTISFYYRLLLLSLFPSLFPVPICSIKNDHPRAVQYYWRALQLNPKYVAAWTLMGHEHVEMRNSSAAIECYRRAVTLNPKDYRAWYGLGQAYEILQMWSYSLYYFRKAITYRPYDPR